MHFRFFYVFFIAITLSIVVISGFSYAQSSEQSEIERYRNLESAYEWELHRSITGIYEGKFPVEYQYNIFPFQFTKDRIAYSSQIISSFDGSPVSKNNNVVIRASHTFGSRFTLKTVPEILERASYQYILASKDFGGQVITNENFDVKGYKGKNLYITYEDKGRKYGIRVKIYLTNFAIIEQIMTGEAHQLYSYKVNNFFSTLSPFDGIGTYKGKKPLGTGWIDYPSKHNLFTAKLPPQNKDFAPLPPHFTVKPRQEVMEFKITDPVINEDVFFNIYAYKFKQKLDLQFVRSLLFSANVVRFLGKGSADHLDLQVSTRNGIQTVRTRLVVSPTKQFPNVNVIKLEARYVGDTIVVKEFLSNYAHSQSGLDKTLFSLVKFHPKKFKQAKNFSSDAASSTAKKVNSENPAEKVESENSSAQDPL